jgi:hypothetical protein
MRGGDFDLARRMGQNESAVGSRNRERVPGHIGDRGRRDWVSMRIAHDASRLGARDRSCGKGKRGENTNPAGENPHEPLILVLRLQRR